MIIALVTLYYPDLKVIENVKSIALQSDIVYLCDNSPHNNITMFDKIENVVYKFFNANLGLSAAFNMILRNGTFNNDDFVIFFDQDSFINDNHIKILIQEYENLENKGYDIGCIGPIYFDTSSNKTRSIYTNQEFETYKVPHIVTSSMLCKYENLKSVRFWCEDIFLDMSDWDLCWRLNKQKKYIYQTTKTCLRHSLGSSIKKLPLGYIRIGQPFRLYYQVRDGLKLLFKNYSPIKFKIRFVYKITIKQLLILIFLNNKMQYTKYYFKGMLDFFLKRNCELKKNNN